MDTDEQGRAVGAGRPNTVVLLSLYLLLLAFFILLNSISHQATDRADLAMGSVAATFNADIAGKKEPNTNGTEAGFRKASDRLLNDVRKIFEQSIPVARILPKRADGTMQVSVPTTALFRPGDSNPRPRVMALFDELAEGVSRDVPGWRFEIDVMLGSGPVLPQGTDLARVLEIRRAGGIAQAFRRLGVDAAAIRTGVAPSDPGRTEIAFHVREIKSARLSLEREGPQ